MVVDHFQFIRITIIIMMIMIIWVIKMDDDNDDDDYDNYHHHLFFFCFCNNNISSCPSHLFQMRLYTKDILRNFINYTKLDHLTILMILSFF